MEFVPAVALLSLVTTGVNFLKYLTHKDWNGVVTQLTVWMGGVAAVALTAQTAWAEGIEVGGQALSSLNGASQVLVGVSIGAGAAVVNGLKKALDTSDTDVKPPFVA